MKLRYRLILLPLIAVAPAIALLAWNQHDLRDARLKEVEGQVLGLAKQATGEVDRIAEGALQFLVALAQVPDIRTGTPECGRLLASIRANYPAYLALIRADLGGTVTCSSIGPGPSIADRPYFRKAVENNSFSVGEFAIGRGTGGASSIHFAYTLRDEKGGVIGVIAAALDLKWFAERLKEKMPPETALNVTDSNGTILVRHPHNEKFSGTQIPDQFRSIIYSPYPDVREVVGLDGVKQLLGYVPVPASTYRFHVGVARNLDSAFADIERAQTRGAVLVGLGLLISLVLAGLWGEFAIRRPVSDLVSNAQRWRGGDYSPAQNWANSELGDIGRSFDDLVSAVAEREERLRDSETKFRDHQRYLARVLDQVPAGIMQITPDKTYAFVNKAFCELLGRSKDEILGHKFTEFTYTDDREKDSRLFDEARVEQKSYTHRKRYSRPDGSIVHSENTVTHLDDDGGILAVCVDLAERIRTENMQERLIRELNHRVRNTLATVQALFTTSSRHTTSTEQLVESFIARIKALSTTHNLLTESLWESASLVDLVQEELEPYRGGKNMEIRGPQVTLTPFQTIALGMVIHELATNAAKYGGLSLPTGSVAVSWDVSPANKLRIFWEELGVKHVKEATVRGFGSRLIEQSVRDLGGSVQREFRPSGLACTVIVPLNDDNIRQRI